MQRRWVGGGLVLVLAGAVGWAMQPTAPRVPIRQVNQAVARAVAPKTPVGLGPPSAEVANAPTVYAGSIYDSPPRFVHLGEWTAVAAVLTPREWEWSTNRIALMSAGLHPSHRDTSLMAQALRFWWWEETRQGGSGVAFNEFSPLTVSQLLTVTKQVAVTTVSMPPLLVQSADKGQYIWQIPTVCPDLTASHAAPCNGVTILWVRWKPGRLRRLLQYPG